VTALKRETAAGLVRRMIADGTLKPGAPAPSGAALARETGYSALTRRAALETLVKDGTLARGVSPTARLRVAQPRGAGAGDTDVLRVALSRALAGRRLTAGLTQTELAGKLGVSLTTVGHAETGRVWQARGFWELAGRELGDGGCLLRLYDQYKAAELTGQAEPEESGDTAAEEAAPAGGAALVLPVSVTITAAGVAVVWPDGTETLAVPPGCQGEPQARQSG
jgi:hypothetical protein